MSETFKHREANNLIMYVYFILLGVSGECVCVGMRVGGQKLYIYTFEYSAFCTIITCVVLCHLYKGRVGVYVAVFCV